MRWRKSCIKEMHVFHITIEIISAAVSKVPAGGISAVIETFSVGIYLRAVDIGFYSAIVVADKTHKMEIRRVRNCAYRLVRYRGRSVVYFVFEISSITQNR